MSPSEINGHKYLHVQYQLFAVECRAALSSAVMQLHLPYLNWHEQHIAGVFFLYISDKESHADEAY